MLTTYLLVDTGNTAGDITGGNAANAPECTSPFDPFHLLPTPVANGTRPLGPRTPLLDAFPFLVPPYKSALTTDALTERICRGISSCGSTMNRRLRRLLLGVAVRSPNMVWMGMREIG